MKIFEFDLETGKKGKLVTHTRRCDCIGNIYKPGTEDPWRIGRYRYASYFGGNPVFHAGDIGQSFGVDTVCFCQPGMAPNTWEWFFCTDRGPK